MLVKRIVDLIISGTLLLLCSPIFLVLMILVWVNLGRPIFFTQIRPGLAGVPFAIVKFRSMDKPTESEIDAPILSDGERLSSFGRVIRATSLDELPTLWNVFKGDMSLVGPRPLLMSYLDRYSDRQARRHDVKPGITGLAQINGRNAVSWEEKFEYDVFYVENQSILLDMKILYQTFFRVLKRDGISQPGFDTASEFLGNSDDKTGSHESPSP